MLRVEVSRDDRQCRQTFAVIDCMACSDGSDVGIAFSLSLREKTHPVLGRFPVVVPMRRCLMIGVLEGTSGIP
jgi:hypothetical protein